MYIHLNVVCRCEYQKGAWIASNFNLPEFSLFPWRFRRVLFLDIRAWRHSEILKLAKQDPGLSAKSPLQTTEELNGKLPENEKYWQFTGCCINFATIVLLNRLDQNLSKIMKICFIPYYLKGNPKYCMEIFRVLFCFQLSIIKLKKWNFCCKHAPFYDWEIQSKLEILLMCDSLIPRLYFFLL